MSNNKEILKKLSKKYSKVLDRLAKEKDYKDVVNNPKDYTNKPLYK